MQNQEEWYRSFFEGKGWNLRVKEIVESVQGVNKYEMCMSLTTLGEKVGRGWAKDNDVRRIDNGVLKHWGDVLQKAKKNGFDALKEAISKLDAEVGGILS